LVRIPPLKKYSQVPPVSLAAAANMEGVFEKLVAAAGKGYKLDAKTALDSLGRTPLHYAAACGSLRISELLMGKPFKLELLVPDMTKNTPLHLAGERGGGKGG
jgi:ankyrin repeat protein